MTIQERALQFDVGIRQSAAEVVDNLPDGPLFALAMAVDPVDVVRLMDIVVTPADAEANARGRVAVINATGTLFEIEFTWPDPNGDGAQTGPVAITPMRGRVRSASLTQNPPTAPGHLEPHALALSLDSGSVVELPLSTRFDGPAYVELVSQAVGFS